MRVPLSHRHPVSSDPSSSHCPSLNPCHFASSPSGPPPIPPVNPSKTSSQTNFEVSNLNLPENPNLSSVIPLPSHTPILPDFNFYFENIPRWSQITDLRSIFSRFGKVTHVFISQKLNRRGLRFGFVNFRRDKNAQFLYENLENVWCGSYRIRVSPAQFDKRTSVQSESTVVQNRAPRAFSGKKRDKRTFVEVVRSKSDGQGFIKGTDLSFYPTFSSKGCNNEWLSRSLVGYVKCDVKLPDLFTLLEKEDM